MGYHCYTITTVSYTINWVFIVIPLLYHWVIVIPLLYHQYHQYININNDNIDGIY